MQFKGNGAATQRTAWNNPGYNMLDWPTFEELHWELRMSIVLCFEAWHSNWKILLNSCNERNSITNSRKWSFDKLAVGCVLSVSHFLTQPNTWNSYRWIPHWSNDACCLKFVWELKIQVIEAVSSSSLNRTVYCLDNRLLYFRTHNPTDLLI